MHHHAGPGQPGRIGPAEGKSRTATHPRRRRGAALPRSTTSDESGWTASSPLTKAWLADDPTGTGTQIALRFLQALQDHDDLAADRQLYGWERMLLSGHDLEHLHTVMNDVRRNAELEHAGRCRGAEWIGSEHVAVHCGATSVIVRVYDGDVVSGVRISDWQDHGNEYHAFHTHAYATVEL